MFRRWMHRRWALVALLAALTVAGVAAAPRAWRYARRYRAHLRARAPRWITFHEHLPKPQPTAEDQRAGFIIFRRSVLERVYPTSRPRPEEVVGSAEIHATLDEYEPVQLAVYPLRDLHDVAVTVTDLVDGERHVIPQSGVSVRMVRYYGAPLSIRVRNRFGVVPKTLEVAVPLDMRKATVRPYWITVHVPDNRPGGLYEGTVRIAHATGERTLPLTVDVIPVKLQEPDILYGTLGMNTLANVWKPRRTAVVLRQADLILRDQRAHGMNTICLRAGKLYQERDGHPVLPDLESAITFAQRYHFTKPLVYSAGTLLKTEKINRSNNYREYDADDSVPLAKRLAEYYTQKVRDAGLAGLLFISVEEPNLKSGIDPADPPDIRERLARQLTRAIKQAGGTAALTCTPESVRCCVPDLAYWIVAFRRFTPALYDMARHAHAHLCMYANATVMGEGTYFSRFMFGYFVWANGIEGMLPWTYPMQPKRFPRNLGHRGEGGLNVIDGFLGLDGEPIPVIQWELSREGIDDARYMVTIEALARRARESSEPARRAAAAEAAQFLAAVRADVGKNPHRYLFEDDRTFEPAPVDDWDAQKFEATRQRAVDVLKALLR